MIFSLKNRTVVIVTTLSVCLCLFGSFTQAAHKSTTKHAPKHRHYKKNYPGENLHIGETLLIDTTCLDNADLIRQNMTKEINQWSNVRYHRGGISKKGVDCSGFTSRVFQHALDMRIPRTSREQANIGENVDKDSLAFGDLLFFYNKVKSKHKRISHVAIYIGNGNFVHSRRHQGVGIDSLDQHYFATHFAFARRIVDVNPELSEVTE